MKRILSGVFLLFCVVSYSQDYITRNGNVSFYSHTPLEDIKADNNEVVSVLNSSTGDMEFKIAIRSFDFAKQAMEDHFNRSDYMDSERFPKAGFTGKITNISDIDFSKDGTYNVNVQGDLTIRDVTKPVTAKGTVTVKDGKVSAQSTFKINRKEYSVIGEAFVQNKIADEIEIAVNCGYEKR